VNGFLRIVAALICLAAFTVPTVSAQISSGIWVDKNELQSLPMSGTAWNNLKSAADKSCGTPDLENQDDKVNTCVMAKALVYARTRTSSYASGVATALRSIVNSGTYGGRALALGRELAAYVIAADLIDLRTYDPSLDSSFRSKIRSLLTASTNDGPSNLVDCHEKRPNNWGTHCGGSRAAVAAYLGDTAELARTAQVFKGWLGDRASYAGFKYGDLAWQYNSSSPVGVNPRGATKSGYNIDGVLPDDQRRAGGFTWPPPKENYAYEALQGALAQAVILDRAGYDVFNWSDRALLRAFTWLHEQADFPAGGDDEWQPWVINYFYGSSFPEPSSTQPGKNVGWTDWTHSGATSSCSFSVSPTSASLPASGGGTQASVTTTSSCAWTAGSNVSWISLNRSSGTGSGTVIATVAANSSSSSRTGSFVIAGRTFTVSQAGTTTTPPAAPAAPSAPSPAAGASSVSTATTLRWTCSGASSYSVRFGTSNPPAQVATGLATTTYTPSALTAGRTYYWQVVGVNASGSTAGPVWSFSTATATTPPPSSAMPSPWTAGDLGSVGLAGSAAYSNGVFTVTGSGAGMTGSADAFHFVRQPLTGHSTITVRLTGLQASGSLAQAGIMMREGKGGVTAGSAHATLAVRPNGSVVFLARTASGRSATTVATTTQAAPVWLRLKRGSGGITASVSTNGSSWRTVGTVSLGMTSKSVVGLVVASGSTSARATATFDNVRVP